jgi:RNA polymerase subunit RPABC4/transcription elongation factor Spt4
MVRSATVPGAIVRRRWMCWDSEDKHGAKSFVGDDAKFCNGCGSSLVALASEFPGTTGIACFACGHLNMEGTWFCAECGVNQLCAAVLSPPLPETRADMPYRSP